MSYNAYISRPRSGRGIVLLGCLCLSRGCREETAELAVMMILTQSTDQTALSRQPSQSHSLCPLRRVNTGLGAGIDGAFLSIESAVGQ